MERKFEYSFIIEQGKHHPLEDFSFFDSEFRKSTSFFAGIYDGHGGDEAARHAHDVLHIYFEQFLDTGVSPQEAFVESYKKLDSELIGEVLGTCATTFYIKDDILYFANVGDSRLVIVFEDMFLQLTTDDRLSNPNERKRIEDSGAVIKEPYYYRGKRGKQTTRALGDAWFKPVGLIPIPHTGEYRLRSGEIFIVAATDGLWDFVNIAEVCKVIRENKIPEKILETLKTLWNNQSADDDVTVMVGYFPGFG